ncbi:SDR family oxidoreductase [Halieaceae bacterium IMCC14734]|uniref:SDR family oxidoreductase n=1 Tax=Candidatus Litorirhabdus singularis TaxID=2518993 RepID=A0ABT3TAM8_9GAMM|nr:SDR family NAD(P)-dependent oxidoreductase [Candidatus Litorirhabdus singularis]MCX2979300.1 SDR family oxidoreductase [Candidatus Litorirhabdus singularis]
MNNRFENKRVFVSGAASGMGRATALRFAAEGARVYCVDLDQDGVEATVRKMERGSDEAVAARLDVTSGDACRSAIADVSARWGGIDVLCNVAGVGGIRALGEETDEGWALAMAVNANGPFYLSQAAMPHLVESRGVIINVISTAGLQGQAYMSSYVASKHALLGLTRTLALEFGRQGVRVNAVCPGGTKTAFLQGFQLDDNIDMGLIARTSLLDEMAEPEDMAASICFLASAEARFANGAILSVDGGSVAG